MFLLQGCRNETEATENAKANKEYKIIHQNYSIVQKNATLNQKFSTLESISSAKQNNENIIEVDGIKIFKDYVTYVSPIAGSKETYSFYVENSNYRLAPNSVQNLVLSKKEDETDYTPYLITYTFPEGINSGSKNYKISRIEKLNRISALKRTSNGKNGSVAKTTSDCIISYTYDIIETKHVCSENVHYGASQISECSADIKPYSTYVTTFVFLYADCGGGDGGGLIDGGSGGPGGGGSSGGSGPTVDTGISMPPTCQTGDCNEEILANKINTSLGMTLNYNELLWLNSNADFAQGIWSMLSNSSSTETKNFAKWGIGFASANNISWTQFQPMLNFAQEFLSKNPDTINPEQIFQRIIDLDNAVKQNPNLLLDITCAQLNQLDDWSNLANHPIPQSVKDKMKNIKNQTDYYNNWEISDLDDGLGARLNMDLFPVKITTMPKKPNSNQRYTPAEFFDFFRKNINLFAEKFTPMEDNYYGIHDTALWNSTNPLGALIHIQIPLDDGTVVCSGVSTNTWIFSTVKAPLDWYHDGVHPVAGNRAFSYYTNPNDGSITIYTRGIDRVSHNYSDKAAVANHIIESLAFTGADNLWDDMQNKLSAYIISKGGQAIKEQAVKYRPKYAKIKDYIKGKTPISSLNCN